MNLIKYIMVLFLGLSFFTSCAPVKFSKSDSVAVKAACEGVSCNTGAIQCSAKINSDLTTFTYIANSGLPSITSNCNPKDVDYVWVVKKADATEITTVIPGLSGENPSQVNFNVLGAGAYYVFLKATKTGSGLNPYSASTPLEFIVPVVSGTLTCDPKLNSNLTEIVIGAKDANPQISSNCNPAAATYLWTATKDGAAFTIPGLSGATATPDIKSLGSGVYRVYLYATLTDAQHWQSTNPLTIRVSDTVPVDRPAIQCNPKINGSVTSLTLTSSSPNPLISANCLPSDIQYTWTVTKNGTSVTMSDLSGANSNPAFNQLGTGTYLIYLTASSANNTSWTSTTPLTITVDNTTPTTLAINCSPRLNNNSVAVTIAENGRNPNLAANCTPANVNYTWSVYKSNQPVSINGLSGATSTPEFLAAGLGTYYIYLNATAAGYNSYVSPSPLEVTVAKAYIPYRDVVFEKTVTSSNNKVDILMVFDDSNSMAPDNSKLAQRLQGFVNDLTASGVDWQMCTTITRAQDINGNGVLYWGASQNWVNYLGSPAWIMKLGASDPYAIFTSTVSQIGAGWEGTDDERGIKAAWWHAEYAQYNSCYRQDASLAVIMISDEDERSVGGDSTQVFYGGELKNLEAEDQPQAYVNKIKQVFGNDKRFTFNSIIVKPGDTSCMTAQDADGAKSHYGYRYSELSQLTNGSTGSICATDYSTNLYYFKDKIINSMASVPLECAPVGDIAVTVTPSLGGIATQVQNNSIIFNPAIPAGRTIQLKYKCVSN